MGVATPLNCSPPSLPPFTELPYFIINNDIIFIKKNLKSTKLNRLWSSLLWPYLEGVATPTPSTLNLPLKKSCFHAKYYFLPTSHVLYFLQKKNLPQKLLCHCYSSQHDHVTSYVKCCIFMCFLASKYDTKLYTTYILCIPKQLHNKAAA